MCGAITSTIIPMCHKQAKALISKRIVVTIIVAVSACAVLGLLTVWIPGLPGPYHGAYVTYASLVNIRGGLQSYDYANGHLPPATAVDTQSAKPSSWRIEIYRQMGPPSGSQSVTVDYDPHKAWNDPLNLRLQESGAWLFRYTAVDVSPPGQHVGQAGVHTTTYYKAITGADTAFDLAAPPSLKQLPKSLILIVRVEESDTHWMEPGDLCINELAPNERTRRLLQGRDGYAVLFADGEGWVLSRDTPISDLCKFFTIAGAKKFDRDKILMPYRVLP